MAAFAKDSPVVSATKFHVPYTALDDGTGAYGTVVNAGNGNWVLGSTLKASKLAVVVFNGTLTGTPTGLKVAIYKGDDANGTNGAVVAASATEWANPAASTYRVAQIDIAACVDDPAKYYSLGLSLNGAGTTALSAAAVGLFLDPAFKS